MPHVLALIDSPVMMLILGAIAVMLFGERLPEVARSFGKQVMDLKKGMHGIQREIENAVNSATTIEAPSNRRPEPAVHEEATAPKFEPPAS